MNPTSSSPRLISVGDPVVFAFIADGEPPGGGGGGGDDDDGGGGGGGDAVVVVKR